METCRQHPNPCDNSCKLLPTTPEPLPTTALSLLAALPATPGSSSPTGRSGRLPASLPKAASPHLVQKGRRPQARLHCPFGAGGLIGRFCFETVFLGRFC